MDGWMNGKQKNAGRAEVEQEIRMPMMMVMKPVRAAEAWLEGGGGGGRRLDKQNKPIA